MRRLALVIATCALGALGACGGDDGVETPRAIVDSPHANNLCGVVWDVQWRLGSRVRGATPDALDLSRYALSPDGVFLSPAGTTCTDTIAAQLTALCGPCDDRPGDCEPLVRAIFLRVPDSCTRCGDAVCYTGESAESCAPDCAHECGDGLCSALESPIGCPTDCAEPCGDGFCGGDETLASCPSDCRYTVGDGLCEPGETPASSPQDCGFATCGDSFCQSYETALRCPEDCCFPAVCNAGYEPRCRGSESIERCVASGLTQCPELVVGETCPHGCTDGAGAGDPAHCRTCAERVADTFSGARTACSTDDLPSCESGGSWTCVAIPGAGTCGSREWTACPDACVDGQCAVDCVARVTALNRPELGYGCALGTPDQCATESLVICRPIDGVAECGELVAEPCAEGSACMIEACQPCTPDPGCASAARRCAPVGLTSVEACVPSCGGWALIEACSGARPLCAVEGDIMAFCSESP